MSAQQQTGPESWKLLTIAFLLLYVPILAFVIPGALLLWAGGRWKLGLGSLSYLGLIPAIAGAALYLSSIAWLATKGRGTPTPIIPTREMVGSGLYSFNRNPQYTFAILWFFGAAIFFDSGVLLGFAAFAVLAFHVGVVWLEEPALRHRFGDPYVRYCARVPRWLPSIPSFKRPP